MKFLTASTLLALSSLSLSLSVHAAGDISAGKAATEKYNCAACHGKDYNTPIDPSYPKVAGQYADYLYSALKSYKTEGNPHIGRSNGVMAAGSNGRRPNRLNTLVGSTADRSLIQPKNGACRISMVTNMTL